MINRTSNRSQTDNIFVNIDEQRLVAHGRHVRSVEIRRLAGVAMQWLASLVGRPVQRQAGGANCP